MKHKDIYTKRLAKYGESPHSLHWTSYKAQAIRFKNLLDSLDLQARSILDAGCGMGDILPFIYARADDFEYLGVDINKDFVKIATKRYPPHKFQVGDPFTEPGRAHFDVVLSSGTLNHNEPNWLQNRQRMITNLFSLANEVLAFNMAGGFFNAYESGNIAYANAEEILRFCLTLTKKVTLRADYLDSDFTVVMYR
jgi:SAM-dependent methyltransferase